MKFDSIQYDIEKGLFKFSFDYKILPHINLHLRKTKLGRIYKWNSNTKHES